MSNKNSLANKKRKRIKYDATSGSITGFLLSSSENVELNNLSDNSLDNSEIPANQAKAAKGRLSLEFDDSFDLFAAKKSSLKKSDDDIPPVNRTSPCRKSSGSSSHKQFNGNSPRKKSSPSKSLNSKSPPGKNKSAKTNTIKKCDYFDKSPASIIPCPFCFKFEEDIDYHLRNSCIRPSCVSDNSAAQLVKIHTEYWLQRRTLGIPDFTLNEDEVFKPGGSQGQKVRECSSESSSDCRVPILKWNSKSKKNKFLLLRQSKSERESKITQKLAILLMGNEKPDEDQLPEDIKFQTIDKSVVSGLLSALLAQELTFWQKSSLGPDEVTEDTYYIKALAPLIGPRYKKISAATPSVNDPKVNDSGLVTLNKPLSISPGSTYCTKLTAELEPQKEDSHNTESNSHAFISNNDEDTEVDAILNPTKIPLSSMPCPTIKSERDSQMKDSCFTEANLSAFTSNDSKEVVTFSRLQTPLSRNWEKMFNSCDLSDTTVLFSDGHFLGHSLVFYAHSIKIFRSISSSSDEESVKLLDWKEIPSLVGRAFLKFIYTGEIQHFKHLNSSDLELIKYLCQKYDESSLEMFIANLIRSKYSVEETNRTNLTEDRNLTSPDIFEDIDSNDSVSNMKIYASNNHRESVNSSTTSKRKLEMSLENIISNESGKRFKTESPTINKLTDEKIPLDVVDEIKPKIEVDKPVVISSDDGVSLSSADTMSPGRFTKITSRPLSQCSTLPPLSESPKREVKENSPLSPPIFPDSPVDNKILTQNIFNNTEKKQSSNSDDHHEKSDNDANEEDNLYYDHSSFDYNYYLTSSWVDDVEDIRQSNLSKSKRDLDESKKENPTAKNSLEKYFDDSLPSNILDCSDICKTPQSIGKSVQGSPMCQSTPTQPIVSSKNLITPSPQILVSDKVTPMLNYSNIISPELKGELRKYGLKPEMDRKKAKTLLRYIYDLIHPIVPESGGQDVLPDDNQQATKTSEDDDSDVKITVGTNCCENKESEDNNSSANTLIESLLADGNEFKEGGVEFDFKSSEEEEEIPSTQERSSYLNKNELMQSVSDFIKRNPILFESILKYEPIWLIKFHRALKENSIKCTKVDLMDVLDELCITFRTEKKKNKR